MFQIKDTLVSLDLAERFFCCDLPVCKGQCCIEGDAGAPISDVEKKEIEKVWAKASQFMTAQGIDAVKQHGVGYIDEEGDLVTTIVNGRDCAFTSHAADGLCLCALEKACREGIIDFVKPSSCSLYPVRITSYPTFRAVNYHRWSICRSAEILGEKLGIRLYRFLERPLTRYFGKDWFDELALCCEVYLEEQRNDNSR